jgi:hypothetical protein
VNKKLWILAALGVLAGLAIALTQAKIKGAARSQARELFPPEKREGALTNSQILIRDEGKGGRPVEAIVVAPFGIRPGEVSPTGYWALMSLHRSYPKADWISVFLAEDSAMAVACQWVGMAQLHNGEVTVTGGIPTQREMDSSARAGNPVHRPTRAELKAVAAVFDSSHGLYTERRQVSRTLLGAGSGRLDKSRFLALDLETAAVHAAAKAQGMDPKRLQALVYEVTRFYWMKAGDPL